MKSCEYIAFKFQKHNFESFFFEALWKHVEMFKFLKDCLKIVSTCRWFCTCKIILSWFSTSVSPDSSQMNLNEDKIQSIQIELNWYKTLHISIYLLCTECIEFFGLTFEFWPQGLNSQNSQNSESLKQFDEMRDDFQSFLSTRDQPFYKHYFIDSQHFTSSSFCRSSVSALQVKAQGFVTQLWDDLSPGNRRILCRISRSPNLRMIHDMRRIQISIWFTKSSKYSRMLQWELITLIPSTTRLGNMSKISQAPNL